MEVVVASLFLAWVDVRGWDEPGDAGAELDGPMFFVDQVLVVCEQSRVPLSVPVVPPRDQ